MKHSFEFTSQCILGMRLNNQAELLIVPLRHIETPVIIALLVMISRGRIVAMEGMHLFIFPRSIWTVLILFALNPAVRHAEGIWRVCSWQKLPGVSNYTWNRGPLS